MAPHYIYIYISYCFCCECIARMQGWEISYFHAVMLYTSQVFFFQIMIFMVKLESSFMRLIIINNTGDTNSCMADNHHMRMTCLLLCWTHTVFFKTRGHLSRLAWPTQRDGLSCLASPRLALRCAAWPSETNPDPCSRPVATSGCSHRYYNGIVHNAKWINIAFFSARQAMFLYKNDCLKW